MLDELRIDYDQRQVEVAGRRVRLTATEFDLLRLLSVNAGGALTSESLARQVWGGKDSGDGKLLRSFVKSSGASSTTMPPSPTTSSPNAAWAIACAIHATLESP